MVPSVLGEPWYFLWNRVSLLDLGVPGGSQVVCEGTREGDCECAFIRACVQRTSVTK